MVDRNAVKVVPMEGLWNLAFLYGKMWSKIFSAPDLPGQQTLASEVVSGSGLVKYQSFAHGGETLIPGVI